MTDKNIEERRSHARVPLDTPHFIVLTVIGGDSHKVMLNNLSATGLQVDLPADLGPEEIPGNSKVEMSEFPNKLEYLNHISGTVVWVTEGYCGVQFDQELDDDAFAEFLESF